MEHTLKQIIAKGRELWEEDCKRFNAINNYHAAIGLDFITYYKQKLTFLDVYLDAVTEEKMKDLISNHYDELDAGGKYNILLLDSCSYEINNDESLLEYLKILA